MTGKYSHIILLFSAIVLLGSCATRKTFPTHYYHENEDTLVQIEQAYRALYAVKPFSVEFTDKAFSNISLEIKTDSIRYIYTFDVNEPRLQDTLLRYGIPSAGVMSMINKMRSIKCIWISMMDYYTNGQKNTLVFMSIRNVAVHLPFKSEKYYILTFYSQPQYYDSEGQLLAGRNLRRLRRINDEIFRRITDKVCYTISGRFR
jgi:hypothetical protein